MHFSSHTAGLQLAFCFRIGPAILLLCMPHLLQAQAEQLLTRYPSMEGVRIFETFYFMEFDPVTAMDLVQRTPGFSPQEESGGRGLAGVRTNILINGKRLPPKGQTVWQQLSNRPYTSVQQLELIDTNAGAIANIDMQGYTQVINVVLVEEKPDYYELNLAHRESGDGDPDQRNQRETNIGLIGNLTLGVHEVNLRGGTFERSSRQPPEFVNIDPANPVQRIANPNEFGLKQEFLEANGNFQLPAASSMSISARLSQNGISSSPIAANGTAGAITESFTNDGENQDISGEFLLPMGTGRELLVAALDSRNVNASNSSFASGGSLLSSRRSQESGETAGRMRYQHKLNDSLTVRSTLSTAFNYFEGTFNLLRDGVPQPLSGSSNRVEEARHSLNLEADWNWKPRWVLRGNISGGAYKLEAEDVPPNEQTEIKGLASISYLPWDRTTITWESRYDIGQLSLNQFLASSNLSSDILQAGAVKLDSERTWDHQLRYDQRFGDRGVLKLTMGHSSLENPIRSMPLSDSLVVSQNAFAEEVIYFNSSIEYPLERIGMEQLIVEAGLNWRDSKTIDPVTGQKRAVNWAIPLEWNLGLRKNPGESKWSWGMNLWKNVNNIQYGVRDTRYEQSSHEWRAFLQWEPINGLRLNARLDSARDNIGILDFYSRTRTTSLQPYYQSYFTGRRDSSPFFSIQWRREQYLEITATINPQPQFIAREYLTDLATGATGMQTRHIAEGPQVQLQIRVYNR